MVAFIDLRFSTELTRRGPALNAIATEMAAAFNAVRAGFGDAIFAEAQLVRVTGTPEAPVLTPYGYLVDVRMDLSATTVTLDQFEGAVRNRWRTRPRTRTALEPWKRAKRVEAGEADDVTEKVTVQVGDVCYHDRIEFPHHGFYDRPEAEVVAP